ncbi:arylamine N-acetyltransferase [Streptomyces sp. NPDC057682]|uniref:arylamine N-acetyltransferase family protein n=1 Tax=Streptomyces sp. NPDC057682 TaxID=3346210 RepID=UPI0036B3167D
MTRDASAGLDLDAYLARIGWSGERAATAAVLRSVHRAHTLGIPFENLDPVRGTVPSLALPDLEAKLVRGGRGGYCYEQNTLLAAALRALGFRVRLLAARVVLGARPGDVRPRTHMLMLVTAADEPVPFVADVGFGGIGALLEPVPLTDGAEVADAPRRHRLVRVAHDGPLPLWELRAAKGSEGAEGAGGAEEWQAQYVFTEEPFEAPDFEAINWHIATNPRSPFSQRLYAQHVTPDAHLSLTGRTLVVTGNDGSREERKLADEAETVRLLTDTFGIRVPEGAVLPE